MQIFEESLLLLVQIVSCQYVILILFERRLGEGNHPFSTYGPWNFYTAPLHNGYGIFPPCIWPMKPYNSISSTWSSGPSFLLSIHGQRDLSPHLLRHRPWSQPQLPHFDPTNFPNLPPYTLALKYFTITSPKYGACNLMTPISYGL